MITSGHFDLGDGSIYYETAGSGEPLLFSHAAFLDSRMFDAQWETFAQHYHVIRYDMRGYGKSSAVSAPVTRREEARLLLEHLGITRAHLLGCSMGGELLLDLAIEQPSLAASLTLVNSTPSGWEMQGAPPRYIMDMMGAMQQGDAEGASELQIRIWLDGEFREPDQVDRALRGKALAMNRIPVAGNTFFIADMQPMKPLDPPALTRLGEVRCPALIVAGSLDNSELVRAAEVMAQGIPHAHKVIIEGAAHVPSYENPAVFNQHLLKFLQAQPM